MGEGAENYIELLGEKLSTIHYHDNLGQKDDHLVIGEGNINWEIVCKKLLEIDYTGPIVSECRNIQPHESAIIFEQKFNLANASIELPQ
jgi:sugar phosphate isomerase/epimerase